MSSKLVKLPKPTRSLPYTIQLPYLAEQVKMSLTVVVLVDSSVQCYGAVAPRDVAMSLLQCGAQRIEQFHQQHAKGSGLVGLDGQPLGSAPEQEGE